MCISQTDMCKLSNILTLIFMGGAGWGVGDIIAWTHINSKALSVRLYVRARASCVLKTKITG